MLKSRPDIDRDGRISNLDALMAVQYTSDKIKTLWSHGYLTKEENPNITSGKVYRIRNPLGGQNLKALSAGSAGTLAEYNRTSDDFKYKFTYLGDGLYQNNPSRGRHQSSDRLGNGEIHRLYRQGQPKMVCGGQRQQLLSRAAEPPDIFPDVGRKVHAETRL